MSVLMQFAMFPTDKGTSASPWVSRIIQLVRDKGFEYQLTSMGTIIETNTLTEAQQIVTESYQALEPDCDRVYCTVTFDIRKGQAGRLKGKVESVERKIGEVRK